MKNCEEMAYSVMERAKAHRTRVRLQVTGVTVGLLCLCAIGLVFSLSRTQSTAAPVLQVTKQAEISTIPQTPAEPDVPGIDPQPGHRIMLLHSISDGSTPVQLQESVQLPYRTLIRLRDITGVTEEQMPAIYAQEEEYINAAFACYSDESRNSWGRYRGENVLITTISVGQFVFRSEDFNAIERLHISVTDVGYLGLVPRLDDYCSISVGNLCIELDSEGIKQAYDDTQNGIILSWSLSPHAANIIKDQPNATLSDYQDVITFTVTFKDGTVETHTINMAIHDNGEVYAIYQGTNR